MRREYEMTEQQMKVLTAAFKPVPYMVFDGAEPRSRQENANAAWCALGREMGFDGMTVRPVSKGLPFFTAEALDPDPDPFNGEYDFDDPSCSG